MVEVPDDRTKYSDYRVLTYSDLTNTNTYKVDTYSFTCDSPLADGVVIYSMENSIKPKDNEFLSMVKSIYMSLNDEEEECLTLDIQRGDSIFTAYVEGDGTKDGDIVALYSAGLSEYSGKTINSFIFKVTSKNS